MSQSRLDIDADGVLAPLGVLHRAPDSYIGFARKPAGKWENLFSLTIAELRAMFPAIAAWLIKDAYFTVNGMYRAAPYLHKESGLPAVWRKEKHLRYLNACYVDLDCGRDDSPVAARRLTWRDVGAALGNMMDCGDLPQSSIFARSGRGVYVFWALRDDDDPDSPPRCWRERLTLYKKINCAIAQRLKGLAADIAATDAARVLRVPGSLNSNASPDAIAQHENMAMYQVQHDGTGQTFTYTLSELAIAFGVRVLDASLPHAARALAYGADWIEVDEAMRDECGASPPLGRETHNPGSVPRRKHGQIEMYARRASDLVTLEQWRGGWPKGRRKWHLAKYAEFLRGAGIQKQVVCESIRVMAGNCVPPYPSDANDTHLNVLVDEVFSGPIQKYTNETLCAWLGITASDARDLELLTIVPEEITQERKAPPGGRREALRRERIDWLRARIERGPAFSSRSLVAEMAVVGIKTNPQTVNEELKALVGLVASRKRAGRPLARGLPFDEATGTP